MNNHEIRHFNRELIEINQSMAHIASMLFAYAKYRLECEHLVPQVTSRQMHEWGMTLTTWVSILGTLVGGLASFVLAWSALRPRQRLFARRFVSRWTERVVVLLVVSYFLWLNINFVLKSGAMSRMEVLLLVVANAEAVFCLSLYLFIHVFSAFLDKRNARWDAMTSRVERLEQLQQPTSSSSQVSEVS
jgi:hypothetical protein